MAKNFQKVRFARRAETRLYTDTHSQHTTTVTKGAKLPRNSERR